MKPRLFFVVSERNYLNYAIKKEGNGKGMCVRLVRSPTQNFDSNKFSYMNIKFFTFLPSSRHRCGADAALQNVSECFSNF